MAGADEVSSVNASASPHVNELPATTTDNEAEMLISTDAEPIGTQQITTTAGTISSTMDTQIGTTDTTGTQASRFEVQTSSNVYPSGGNSQELLEPSAASPYQYVATAQKSTAVGHAVTGNFVKQHELSVIISKGSYLEVFTVGEDGLDAFLNVNIYGRIAILKLFRPLHEKKDLLLIVTENYQFCVVKYDEASKEIKTHATGDVRDRVGRPADAGILGLIDPLCRMIGLRMYNGVFKVIPVSKKGHFDTAYNVRLEEIGIIDIVFLHGYQRPTLLILYEDHRESRHLKTYEMSMREKDMRDGPWSQNDIEAGAHLLISVHEPVGGAIVIGEQSISYHNGEYHTTIAIKNTIMTSYTALDTDKTRFLLSDHTGTLFVLKLIVSASDEVVNIAILEIGCTPWASCMTYIDNNVVFIGSAVNDSQLIRLRPDFRSKTQDYTKPDSQKGIHTEPLGYFDVLETFMNIGPIVDLVVLDRDRQGQGQIVTCSGVNKDGSLRVIRNGIGIYEHAAVDICGVKGVWPAREGSAAAKGQDNVLCVAFIGETRFIRFSGDEMEVFELEGLKADAQSLYCGNVQDKFLVQVVGDGARVVDTDSGELVSEWLAADGVRISVCAGNSSQLVLAMGGSELVYLRVDQDGVMTEVERVTMDHEIACLGLSPVGVEYPGAKGADAMDMDGQFTENEAHLVTVGLWTDISIRALYLPSLTAAAKVDIGGDIIPRSLVVSRLDDMDMRVICALGDGTLVYYTLAPNQAAITADDGINTSTDTEVTYMLTDRKHVTLATQPIELSLFRTNGRECVFAASDRPAVIYSSHGKLVFSNVNVKDVAHMCPLNSEAFPESLAVFSDMQMTIGTIDEIEKLHVRTIPLDAMPRRIQNMESTATLLVATIQTTMDVEFKEHDISRLSLYDELTFEVLDTFEMEENEDICSLCVVSFDAPASESAKDGEGPLAASDNAEDSDTQAEAAEVTVADAEYYYAVGTAFVLPAEDEPKAGRVYLFKVVDSKLVKICVTNFKSAPYSMCVASNRLVVSLGSKICLYSLRPGDGGSNVKELALEYSYHGGIVYLYLKGHGDFILAGDLMKSVSLLVNKSSSGQLELVALDYDAKFMTAVEMLDDEHFLGTDTGYNIFTLKKNAEAATDEERECLDVVGGYHTGEFINVFRHGSLVMRTGDEPPEMVRPNVVFGTVSGMIGVMGSLTEEMYLFLDDLQTRLAEIKGVGGLSHSTWREYKTERRMKTAWHYIDGDLIEWTLELPRSKLVQICKGLKWWKSRVKRKSLHGASNEDADVTVEGLIKFVEDIARIH